MQDIDKIGQTWFANWGRDKSISNSSRNKFEVKVFKNYF